MQHALLQPLGAMPRAGFDCEPLDRLDEVRDCGNLRSAGRLGVGGRSTMAKLSSILVGSVASTLLAITAQAQERAGPLP